MVEPGDQGVARAAPVADWLLLPGWGFGASSFDEVRAALPPALVVEAVACRDAAAAIDRRISAVQAGDAAPFGVCAWSLGATIAFERASRGGGAIAALLVTGATPRFVACDDWPHAMPAADFDAFTTLAASSAIAAQSRLTALCALGAAQGPALLRRLRRSFDCASTDERPEVFERTLLDGLDVLGEVDLRDRLATIDLPVTVLHGECDGLVPAAAAHMLSVMLPRAAWIPVAGAGHGLPVTHAALLAATIARMAGLQPVDAQCAASDAILDVNRL